MKRRVRVRRPFRGFGEVRVGVPYTQSAAPTGTLVLDAATVLRGMQAVTPPALVGRLAVPSTPSATPTQAATVSTGQGSGVVTYTPSPAPQQSSYYPTGYQPAPAAGAGSYTPGQVYVDSATGQNYLIDSSGNPQPITKEQAAAITGSTKSSSPSWLLPAAIGAGALVLLLVLRQRSAPPSTGGAQ